LGPGECVRACVLSLQYYIFAICSNNQNQFCSSLRDSQRSSVVGSTGKGFWREALRLSLATQE